MIWILYLLRAYKGYRRYRTVEQDRVRRPSSTWIPAKSLTVPNLTSVPKLNHWKNLNDDDLESISKIECWVKILNDLGERYWKRRFQKQFSYDHVFLSLLSTIEDFSSYTMATRRVWMTIRKKSDSVYFSRNNENENFRQIPSFIKQDFNQR